MSAGDIDYGFTGYSPDLGGILICVFDIIAVVLPAYDRFELCTVLKTNIA